MTPNLRPVAALPFPAGTPVATEFGDEIVRERVDPAELLIDDGYQRDLNRKSYQLIWRMVATFKWRNFKTPTCVRVGRRLHVVDGQHSAIAAATLKIKKIPVDVVDAATALDRAEAFVAHNRDRLSMTAFDIHRALVGAGDPHAKDVDRACKEAGVRIIRVISKVIVAKVGDTAAIGLLSQIVKRRGADDAGRILSALVKGGRAPISAAEIAGAEDVMFPADGRDPLSMTQLSAVVREMGGDGVIKCNAKAKTDLTTAKVVLAAAYRRAAQRKAPA